MPLIYRTVGPVKLSSGKLELKGKTDSEYTAVNNETLVNVLRQLASVVTHASDIFSDVATLTEQVGKRVRSVKLRLDELEAKSDLFDPRLVPVPEGTLDDISNACTLHHRLHGGEHNEELVRLQTTNLIGKESRPRFLIQLYANAGNHQPVFPPRSPILSSRRSLERQISVESRRPASFAALRDWKLDDFLDEKIATLGRSKKQSAEALNRALASPFPSQVVQVDVTGAGFDRMKANRRSLVVHTKKIRKKRRNTICGSLPNKECGIQTSFTSVASPGGTGDEDQESGKHRHHHHSSDDQSHHPGKKYGIDSGHWSSSCTSSAQGVPGVVGSSSVPSPWDPNSLSTSSDYLFDEEDRCLTPQLENFTDGFVSDSDSVDTDGYFTSFRSDCGFPRAKKSASMKDLEESANNTKDGDSTATFTGDLSSAAAGNKCEAQRANQTGNGNRAIVRRHSSGATSVGAMNESKSNSISATENEYELFGKGSTSTTASSCGTVVMRNKPDPPTRTTSTATAVGESALKLEENGKGAVQTCESSCGNEDVGLEERVKRKSLIERVPSMVVVTPSPSCSSGSPPPLKDPGVVAHLVDESISAAEDSDNGRLTPKADDLLTTNESECGTLSDTDSDRRMEVRLSDIAVKKRSTSDTSSTGTASTSNSTLTLTSCPLNGNTGGLPQPDVIPAEAVVQQLQIIRTNKGTPRLDKNKEYYSLDTVLLGSFEEELSHQNGDCKKNPGKEEATNGFLKTSNSNHIKKLADFSALPTASSPIEPATSGKIRGARVVLDANGEIIFSSETLTRKRKQKVSFEPGSAVKSPDYDSTSAYSRVRESVYDRIKKDTGDPEKLYECIEEIRRHNLKPRDPFLDAQLEQIKKERNSSDNKTDEERSGSSASSTLSSSSPSKSCSTPDNANGLLETDLDSAIPPVMPDLKNLPKIKDRLKRNESYRIANTDDVPGTANPTGSPTSRGTPPGTKLEKLNGNLNRSPLSPLHLNRNMLSSLTKRMSLTSPPSTSPTPLHLNKKRDIPEEDPNFIQQMFSSNSAANNRVSSNLINGGNMIGNSNGGNHFNHHSLLKSPPESSSKISLSKFTLTPEDRPSFLRRDSPPTMDEISKEIYRFRKRFNIQPNASTTTLTRPGQRNSLAEGSLYSTGSLRGRQGENQNRPLPRPSSSIDHYQPSTSTLPKSATALGISKSTIPVGFPKLSVEPSPQPSPITSPAPSLSSVTEKRASSAFTRSNYSPVTVAPSPIYFPSYGWSSGTSTSPKCSTPLGFGTPTPPSGSASTLGRSPRSGVPPVPPTRAFGSGRKIFPLKPMPYNCTSMSGSSTSTSVPSLKHNQRNQYHSATRSEEAGGLTNSNSSYDNSGADSFSFLNDKSNYRKSLLPSLPFRRSSVAFTESSSSSSSSSPFTPTQKTPRTSIGEFKRLLQASQKKRNSISAVEVLKPKGLETTL